MVGEQEWLVSKEAITNLSSITALKHTVRRIREVERAGNTKYQIYRNSLSKDHIEMYCRDQTSYFFFIIIFF